MKKGLSLFCLMILGNWAFSQWEQMPSPEVYNVRFLVKHHDKAYAGIAGALCAGDKESEQRYAFYNIDVNSTGLRCAASWGDYFVTGTTGSLLSVYSDVSIAQKLTTRSLAAGIINCVSVKDHIILAGTDNGIYRSVDTLKSAQLVSPVNVYTINQFAYAGSHWYAATTKGVFSSQDQGASWQQAGLANTVVNSIEFLGDTVYAATNTGLLISDDHGQNWEVHPYFSTSSIMKLILQEGTLFINTRDGLYKKEAGASINPAFLGLAGEYTGAMQLGRTSMISSFWGIVVREDAGQWIPAISPTSYEAKVQVLAGNDQVLLAGTDTRGLFASFDKGRTWIMRSPPFDFGSVYGILSAYTTNNYWFSTTLKGIYRSSDEGAVWILKNNGLPEATRAISYFTHEDKLWICTNKGLFYSTDFGDTWQTPASSISSEVRYLVKNSVGKFYASTSLGLYESVSPYDNWAPAGFQSVNLAYGLAQWNDTLYAATNGSGIFQSNDGGESWNDVNDGLKNLSNLKIVANDSHALTINGLGNIYVKLHKEQGWSSFNDDLILFSAVNDIMILKDTVYVSAGFDGLHKRALSDYSPVLGIKHRKVNEERNYIYPNPANDLLNFQNKEDISRIEILEQSGKIVLSSSYAETLDISAIQCGFYFVKIFWKDNYVTEEKLVVW